MRYRLLLQLGVFHKPKDNPQADFIKLATVPLKELLYEGMNNVNYEFTVKEIHKLADGTPHTIEFESIVDVDPELPAREGTGTSQLGRE